MTDARAALMILVLGWAALAGYLREYAESDAAKCSRHTQRGANWVHVRRWCR